MGDRSKCFTCRSVKRKSKDTTRDQYFKIDGMIKGSFLIRFGLGVNGQQCTQTKTNDEAASPVVSSCWRVWVILTALFILVPILTKAQCPAPSYANNPSGCSSEQVTLAVTSMNSSSVTQHRWYTTQTGWTQITPSRQFSPTSGVWTSQLDGMFSSNVTYWVSSVCNGTESSTRTSVTFTRLVPGNITINTGGNPPYMCIGNSMTLTPQGGSNYSWSSSPAGASGSGSITVSPTVNTTYTVTGIESVCDTQKSTSLTISVAPKVGPVTITGSPSICQGTTSTQYVASATNVSYYQWNITPSAGTINSSGLVTWNASFVGEATVNVTAFSPTNCNHTTTDSHVVTVKGTPTVANAGVDQIGSATCGSSTVTLGANTPGVGTGSWSVVAGTGGSFGNSTSPVSTFSGTPGNTYTLRWTISNSPCAPSSDDVVIKFNQMPTTAAAGTDQTGSSTCGVTSVTLAANAPLVGTGEWTIISGTLGNVVSPSNPASTFNGIAGNTYTLRWTNSNSPCAASTDDVVIKFNQNPTLANAGQDQTGSSTCGLTSVALSGNTPTIGNGSWTVISGAGGYFDNASSANSLFSGSAGTAYVLKWTTSNAPCPSSIDDVNVTFNVKPTSIATVTGNSRYGSGLLNLAATGAQTSEQYKWYNPSNALLQTGSSYTTPVVSGSSSNYCYVEIANSASCPGPKAWVNIEVYPLPVINSSGNSQYLSYGNTIQLSTSGYHSYQWAKDGVNILGGTHQTLTAREPGVYTVKVKGSSNSPEAISDAFTIFDAIPSQDENYISTVTFLKEGVNTSALFTLKPEHYSQSTTYFDGLGRPMQTVTTMGSPNQKDIVQPILYDDFGREFRKYLPFTPDDNSGRYKDNAALINSLGDYIGIAASFYDNPSSKVADDDDDLPFVETRFDGSPLNRVFEQGAAGLIWHPDGDKTIKMEYLTNTATEVLLWTYSGRTNAHPLGLINATDASNLPVRYGANQLFKNVTKDENNHEIIEYKDKEGRVVLKRVQAANAPVTMGDSDYASTYYIYDDFGQLVCVVPPEAVKRLPTEYYHAGADNNSKEAFLSKWAFRYRYDERKRMIMKQVPGADSVTMVYDKRDRLVLTQDGNQRDANKWLFTKYDELNRPVMTGIYTHGSTLDRDDMTALVSTTTISESFDGTATNYGYSSNVFPTSNVEVLTVTYYDKYDFKSLFDDPNDDPNGLFDFKNDEVTANNGLKAQEQAYFPRVQSQVTGTATRILNSSTFLWSVNYYDDRYRLIQSTTSNHKGGVNRTTNVYDFAGKVLRTNTRYIIPGDATHPDTKILKRFSYDHAGRLIKTWHQVEGGPEVVISFNEYNELGQLVTKKLHQATYETTPVTADPLADQAGTKYNEDLSSSSYSSTEGTYIASNSIRLLPGFIVPLNSTFQAKIGYSAEDALAYNNSIEGEYLQTIDYRYNIRGWLKRINDPAAPLSDDLFNMELHYNTPTSNGGDAQYNGNISEAIWKSAGLDKQSYGYDYDPMNRIMGGKYFNLARPSQNGRYDEMIGDPTDLINYPAYDLNGNIQNLVRNGETAEGAYGVMDKLHYTYKNADLAHSGNQLMYVADDIATGTDEQGFKDLSTGEGATDYLYDDNGNLVKDENKGIIAIEYNHLNLPSKVSKSGTEYIIYKYDATGRKLAQQVVGIEAKSTDYMGEMVFENNSLQFISHGEGRVIPMTEIGASDSWEYQYHLKDHLGNVRLTLTTNPGEEVSLATLETVNVTEEQNDFLNYDEAVKVNYALFDHTYDGTTGQTHYSTRLTGGNTNAVYGLAKSLSVMPGDTIKMQVFAKYLDPNSSNWTPALASFMAAVVGGTAPQGTVIDGGSPGSIGEQSFPFANVFDHSGEDNTAPKAYLNFIVFDRDYNPIIEESGYIRITPASREYGNNASHDLLKKDPLVIKESGYVYIYLSNENETSVEVFFDDFEVEHVNSSVVQIDDYYPFGLTFNSYTRDNTIPQNYRYNGKELQDEFGLRWLDYGARMYQPELAKWTAIDPMSHKYRRWSPYNYAINNPLRFIDPDGREIVNYGDKVTFTDDEATTLLRILQTNSRNKQGNKLHYVYEGRTPEIYQHTLNAFKAGKPQKLHYDKDRLRQKVRRDEATGPYPVVAGKSRDEYPYASTYEGGKGAMVAYVSPSENSRQGYDLQSLYATMSDGDAFYVIPVPKEREPEKEPAPVPEDKPVPVIPVVPVPTTAPRPLPPLIPGVPMFWFPICIPCIDLPGTLAPMNTQG